MRINLFSDAENLSFLAIAALLIVAGCSKNAPDTLYKENKQDLSAGLSVKEAMLWYENHPTPQKAFRNEASGRYAYKIRTAYWDRAINAMDSNYYIVEAPVVFDQSPGFIISGTNTSGPADQPNDVARLLILKNKRTGEMHSALMHIVSDNGTQELSITYNKRSSHFSGFIFYTDTEGNFINGWKYENGKITRKSSKSGGMTKTTKRVGTGSAVSLMAPPDPGPVNCTTYETDWYERTCTEYTDGSVSCTPWEYLYTTYQTYCENPGGGGGGGGIGGDVYNENDVPANSAPSVNQDIIDSLTGYPCAQEILKQLPSINAEVDSIINKIFGTNEDVNLKFTVDNSLTKDSLDGYTKFPGGSAFFFDSKIQLNPWVLQNSTKEYILVTMLHEAIHSYIDYWYNQYLVKQIDSTTFKTKFPIFWNYKSVLHDPTEIAEHNTMANNYINTMKNAIKSYNPNVTDAAAEALAWGGLQQTTVWQTKSDTTNILNINWNSRDVSLNKYSQYNFQKCL